MFLKYINNFFLKKRYNNKWIDVRSIKTSKNIQTVGLFVDESQFKDKELLVRELVNAGFHQNNITLIVYKDKINANEEFASATFDPNVVRWNGDFTNDNLRFFVQTEFDLLINYYSVEKFILMYVTNASKAKFKTGFSTIDSRLNHLMIDTDIENYSVFVKELIKYLKILNKI